MDLGGLPGLWTELRCTTALGVTDLCNWPAHFNLKHVVILRYDWGEYPMDTHFPVYGRFQPGLAEAVRTVQAAGVKCLPYTNARVFSLNETQVPT